jgi:penicillin-insensitive murein endopeptidase
MLRLARALFIGLLTTLAACESNPRTTPAPTTPAEDTTTPPAATSGTAASALFGAVRDATTGAPEVFGSYTKGCIAGATQLDANGPHLQIANPGRNRAWGHPQLIAFVEDLAAKVAADGHGGLIVGDLAQPRGGPMRSGHASHQVGLDADIWLQQMPERKLSPSELNAYNGASYVDFSSLRVTNNFGEAQYSMLKHAAKAPGVERIFISPPIKREMCDRAPADDRAWLRKLRPWTGHAAHMHVRLACPTNSDDCKAQDEPPEGDGCGAELQSWFADRSWMRPKPGPAVPSRPMGLDALPAACRRVLVERG